MTISAAAGDNATKRDAGLVRGLGVWGLAASGGAYGYIEAWLGPLARGHMALAGAPLDFCWLGVATAVGVASMLAVVALASRAETLGLLALIAISAAVYFLQIRFVHPATP